MPVRIPCHRRAQRGGITILVALMLLVLLVIASVGMSRNALREVVTSGIGRQGSEARNLAESGGDFSILWMAPPSLRAAAADSSAAKLQALADHLLVEQLYGSPYGLDQAAYHPDSADDPPDDLQMPAGSGNGFNLALTAMGKLPVTNQSQSAGSVTAGFTPAIGGLNLAAPDLWAVRSDAVVKAGGMSFYHSKEVWITSPPR